MGVIIRIAEVPRFYSPQQEDEFIEEVKKSQENDSPFMQHVTYPEQVPTEMRKVLVGLELWALVTAQGKLLIDNTKGGKRRRRALFADGNPGYAVNKDSLVEKLQSKSKEAAEWWQNNWHNCFICFGSEEAVVIRHDLA